MKQLCPPDWPRPKGYSNALAAHGRIIVTAGVVGWNERQEFVEKRWQDSSPRHFAISWRSSHATVPRLPGSSG